MATLVVLAWVAPPITLIVCTYAAARRFARHDTRAGRRYAAIAALAAVITGDIVALSAGSTVALPGSTALLASVAVVAFLAYDAQ